MDRTRARSASPLVRFRGKSNSIGEVVTDNFAPRAGIPSSSEGNLEKAITSSANQLEILCNSAEDALSTPNLGHHHPRQLSKFDNPKDNVSISTSKSSIIPYVSDFCMMVRSKSSFSIQTNAFTAIGHKKYALERHHSLRESKDTIKVATVDIEVEMGEGLLRDLERKGFYGLWSHTVTR
jgi:hypothetical protein